MAASLLTQYNTNETNVIFKMRGVVTVKPVKHWIVTGQHIGHSKLKKVASYVLLLELT